MQYFHSDFLHVPPPPRLISSSGVEKNSLPLTAKSIDKTSLDYLCEIAVNAEYSEKIPPNNFRPSAMPCSGKNDDAGYNSENDGYTSSNTSETSNASRSNFYNNVPLTNSAPFRNQMGIHFDPMSSYSDDMAMGSVNFNSMDRVPPMDFPVHVKLMQVGNNLHLAPMTGVDTQILLDTAMRISGTKPILVLLHPGVLQGNMVLPNEHYAMPRMSSEASAVPAHAATAPAAHIQPKHIYKTCSGTYRVQVGKGSKQQRNGKFSRNAQTETEALWLCEMALIIIDNPITLEDIARIGNFKYIQQKGFVVSEEDFAVKLVEQAELLKMRGLLKDEECEKIITCFRNILPQDVFEMLTEDNLLFKPKQGTEGDEQYFPKKRRRSSPKTQAVTVPQTSIPCYEKCFEYPPQPTFTWNQL
eukprot:gene5921-11949_t